MISRLRDARLGLRVLGGALLAAGGGIHLWLWCHGDNQIVLIGPALVCDAGAAGLLALAVLAVPRPLLGVVALLGALFSLGELLALVLS